MEFAPTPAQEEIREEARRIAEEVCAPEAAARDARGVFPRREIDRLAEAGWLGMRLDPPSGGRGLDAVSAALAVEEFSRGCASIGLLIGFHNFIVCDAVARHATADVRQDLLPKLARGDLFGAVALADPTTSTGEETAAVAIPDRDTFQLRGVKPFVPGAVGAGLFLVYAFTGGAEADPPPGRIVLLVPRSTPGLSVGPPDPLVGVRASGTASLTFEDCVVPAAFRLDTKAQAHTIVKDLLVSADLVVAAQAVGIARAALETSIGRAGERELSDSLVGSHQSVQFMIAGMLVALDASRLLLLRAAQAYERGSACAYEAVQAKAYSGRAAVEIADAAIQVLGGDGTLADHGIERQWRDAKTCELNPSTREAAQLFIARCLIERSP